MAKTGTPPHVNKIGCKKINHYTQAQCHKVMSRLAEDKQDNSKYFEHVKSWLVNISIQQLEKMRKTA